MTEELESRVWDLLKQIGFRGMSRDIVSFGFVDSVKASGSSVDVRLKIRTQDQKAAEKVREDVTAKLGGLEGIDSSVGLEVVAPLETGQSAIARDSSLIPGVERVIAVASGKGGVGKSTVAVNLALALGRLDLRVGLLDADIYGPSLPMMLGLSGKKPQVGEGGNMLRPFDQYGIKVMSLGFILDVDTPVIWRGPMVMKAIVQLLGDVEWGELDYLVVDLPPGTGDAQLTLTQKVPLSGAVIVTTPQDVALVDARKGLAMFQKVNVPVLGIIENMSSFVCPECGTVTDIFKKGGGERTAKELDCTYLGSIPLDPAIAAGGDSGVPITVADPDGLHGKLFRGLAERVRDASSEDRPQLSIQ